MRKRFTILILVLLLLVVAVSPTLAHERPGHIAGEITAIYTDTDTVQLTVRLRYGTPVTVQIEDETEFLLKVEDVGLEPFTFEELAVGDRIHVWGMWDEGVLYASKVIVMPESKMILDTLQGTVSVVNSGNLTITVLAGEEDLVVLQTTVETKFYRVVQHGRLEPIAFSDLFDGDRVKAQGDWVGEIFNAYRITVMPLIPSSPPPNRASGEITDLDLDTAGFTLEKRGGYEINILTSAETRFYDAIRRGQLEAITFSDLALEDMVFVSGEWVDDQLKATQVIVKASHGGRGPGVFIQVDQ